MKCRLCIVLFAFSAVIMGGCASAPSTEATTQATPVAASALPPLKVAVYADNGPSGIGAVEWFRLVNESP